MGVPYKGMKLLTPEDLAKRKWQDEDGEWGTDMDSGEIHSTTFEHDGTIVEETVQVKEGDN